MAISRSVLLGTLVVLGVGRGDDFPLVQTPLALEEALSNPGRAGALVRPRRPSEVRIESKPSSAHPLYGQFDGGMAFRLDESKGAGAGYDQLVVDLNRNGNLADDVVWGLAQTNSTHAEQSSQPCFGPVAVTPPGSNTNWQPSFFAQLTLYDPKALASPALDPERIVGYLSTKAASALVTTVSVDHATERIALLDGNCNFRLGDAPRLATGAELLGRDWEQTPADFILRDRPRSGQFARGSAEHAPEFWANPAYFDGKPYTLTPSPDGSRLGVEPYAGPTGTLEVSGPAPIRTLVLARALRGGEWDAVTLSPGSGALTVPAGTYRLLRCVFAAQETNGMWTVARAHASPQQKEIRVQAGTSASLECAVPLELHVEVKKEENGFRWGLPDAEGSVGRYTITAKVVGPDGTSIAQLFHGRDLNSLVPIKEPKFEIINEHGWPIASGEMESGQDGNYTQTWAMPAKYAALHLKVSVEIGLGAFLPPHEPLKSIPVAIGG